ncbi:choice-of-anchor L domain-containing protein [Neptunitalea lumnitzerae]|uniref:Fibronectin type-III domain-containing protein n=1 Tax=Neptunitalea lumnitzerae TaxID=2965509 RepID=A0ABQ5MHA9_9FLAO|nr:choice-of-anchor L domain-containing protein [Neptunitalea sp. Y10]GLB48796.1 hypothetical protein Y10_11640 [Neptunitalea sp. Y10]
MMKKYLFILSLLFLCKSVVYGFNVNKKESENPKLLKSFAINSKGSDFFSKIILSERDDLNSVLVTKNSDFVCFDVTNIVVDALDQTTVDFSWTAGGTETDWEYVVQAAGTGVPTASGTAVTTLTVNETGLTAATDYEIYVRADCGAGDYGAWVGPVAFTTACTDVSNVTVNSLTFDSVTFTWTNGGAESNWEFVVQSQGQGVPTVNGTATANTFASETGLTPNTNYEIYVRSDCGNGNYGEWIGPVDFLTPCANPTILSVDYITDEEATVSWAPGANETDWEVSMNFSGMGVPTTNIFPTSGATELQFFNLIPETEYDVYIRANCGNGNYSEWIGPFVFTTMIETDYVIDCNAGPLTLDFCYLNNQQIMFSFTNTEPLTVLDLAFNSGMVEDMVDEIRVFDSDGTTLLYSGYGNSGDLSGLEFTSTDSEIFLLITTNETNSCDTGEITDSMNFTVSCNTCTIFQDPTFELYSNCSNGQSGFYVNVLVPDMGLADSLSITDNQGTPAVPVPATGVYQIGPYDNGDNVVVTVANSNNALCFVESSVFTQTECPPMSISYTQYTHEELVEEVLIKNDCAQISNVNASTGINFGEEFNGVAYFYDAPGFNFNSGLVLVSGDASKVPGPNGGTANSDGTMAGWPGDPYMDTLASQVLGTSTNTYNESYIEFDFVPVDNFISFDFVFASEEYGTDFECQFSDVFAFILTDPSGVSTNLAIIPGTTPPQPVSVLSVNGGGFTTPTTCGAANPGYFGGYYGSGTGVIDFNGYTQVFTAQSPVVSGNTYHIKLSVVDAGDANYDSAVFLGEGTFNIGNALGEDLTVIGQTAPCKDEEVVLEVDNDPNATYEWYFEGTLIPGEDTYSYTVTSIENGGLGAGTYSVYAALTVTCPIEDEIYIEFAEDPIINTIDPYVLCENAPVDGYDIFDLTTLETEILGGQTNIDITFYETEQGAIDGTNTDLIPIPDNYPNMVPYEQTVYIRLENTVFGCTSVNEVRLIVSHVGVNEPDETVEVCDEVTPGDGYEEFDLTEMGDYIMGGQTAPDYLISYYTSFTDALNGFAADQIATPEAFTNTEQWGQTIYVRVDGTAHGCNAIVDFDIVVNPLPDVITLDPYYGCDYDGTGIVTYYLNDKTDEILNGQTGISVTFYDSMDDLEDQINALPNAYVNSEVTHDIYVRLENPVTGCYNTTVLTLMNMDVPVMNAPTTLTFCDDDNDGFGEFYLEQTALDVVPADGNDYTVTFHVTQSDAENDVNVFTSPYENIVQDNQTIYVRVENDLTGCYDVDPLPLIVNPTPVVPFDLPDMEICDDQLADGRAEFDLSEQNVNVYGSQSTADFTISYYETEIEAVDAVNAISTNYYVNQVAFLQTIYVRLEDNVTGCFTVRDFDLIVNPNPVINPSYDYDLALCDDFGQPGDQITEFDLTVKNDEITGGVNGYIVSYYETEADAEVGVNAIADDTAYENTVSPYTLHVRVEDANTGCYSLTTLTLRVLNNPSPQEVNPELEVCDDDSDGDSTNGQAEFDLTLNEEELLNGELGVTATYYETYQDAFDGTNAIPNPEAYYNTVQFAQTIYVGVTNDDTGCLTIVTIDINVNSLPEVTDEPTYFLCEVDNDDVETILLTDMDSFVLDEGDATGLEITYYETEANAIDDEEEYVNSTITINGTEQIYARVENTDTGCYSVVGFLIDIEQAPLAFTPDPIVYCESLGADGYYNNDGVEVFNLEEVIETIRGSQDPDTYPVAIYTSLADAEAGINAIPTDELNPYTSGTATLYAVVTNVNTTCTNGDPIVIELIVEPIPEISLENAEGIICTDATNNPVIGTDLGAEYIYQWNTGETTPTIEITEAGEYYVTVTDPTTINQCAYESNHVYYEEASLPAVTPTVVQSEIFDGQNSVQVTANGAGVSEYGYQLDNGSMQYSGTFNNVEPGIHTVTITELNGCGSLTLEVSVIDYMKYFTPNGDGVNDTWRVIGLESQENAQVFIFDRQGKMVKQMNATSDGWNGTFNGNLLPSSDYWFKVVYTEPSTGEVREFNSHFSLKR